MADPVTTIRRLLMPVAGARTVRMPPTARPVVRQAISLAHANPGNYSRLPQQAKDYQAGVEALAAHTRDYGPTQELLDFLASHDVPEPVVQRVASGELDMSDPARAARAEAIGLNPNRLMWRYDYVGKPVVLGRERNALQYTSFFPDMARKAAQTPWAKHSLWGPAHVAGIDPAPRPMGPDDLLHRLKRVSDENMYSWWRDFVIDDPKGLRVSQHAGNPVPGLPHPDYGFVAEEAGPALARRQLLQQWDSLPAVRYGILENGRRFSPGAGTMRQSDPEYGEWSRQRSMVPDLKEMGYQGVLVRDEAPYSVAYFGPTPESPLPAIRHSALSALDPEFRYSRNMFMSLLPLLLAGRQGEEQ